jgi:hypothetical protein
LQLDNFLPETLYKHWKFEFKWLKTSLALGLVNVLPNFHALETLPQY